MIIYCETCGKDFNKKYYYDRHKNRKNPCKPKKIDENIGIKLEEIPLQNTSNYLQNTSNYLQNTSNFLQNSSDFLHAQNPVLNMPPPPIYQNSYSENNNLFQENFNNEVQKKNKKKIFTCEFCEKTFSRNDNLQRHLKNRCKSRNDEDTEIEKLKKKIEELSKTNENLEKRSTININNNIQLNPFGKENLEYIKEELLRNAIKVPHFGLPNLIRLIHFNKDHPENMNVKQRNKKKPMVDVYNGKEWITMDKNDTIHNMVASKKELMDNYFDKFQEFDDYSKNNYERFSYSVDSYLKSQLPKTDCFETIEVTNKCKELYKSFIYKIDILLINREAFNQNTN